MELRFAARWAGLATLLLAPAAQASTTLTQNLSDTLVTGVSISCNAGGIIHENSFYRAFDLADYGITDPFETAAVTFGVDTALAGSGGAQTVTIKLYDNFVRNATTLDVTGNLIGSADVSVADGSLYFVTKDITATTSTGKLVCEIFVPDGTAALNSFWIGANQAGETAPSYVRAPDCDITTPTTFAALGFDCNVVMNVVGSPVPEPTTLAALGIGALALVRRRGRK